MIEPLRPPETDDEPEIERQLRKQLARDALLSAVAGIVILMLLAYLASR